jgi:hypothetical protein
MAVRIQLRRGNNSEFSGSLVLTAGEAALVEDEKVLIVGDGSSTYTQLKAAGKFINYQTEQGLGTVGGANATGETPLTVKGVGSQTAAILKVTDSGDSAILQIFDDEGPTVRLEDHGATDEVFMLLKQQASGTANALELKDSADTDQMTISCDGEVAITPTNNQTADAPSLDVKGSAATQSNGILRVKDSSNNAVLTVKSDGVESKQTVTVDGGSIIAQVEDTAASNVTITASATDSDKVVTVDGNGGTENFSVTAGGSILSKFEQTSFGSVTDDTVLRYKDLRSIIQGSRTARISNENIDSRVSTTSKIQELVGNTDGSMTSTYVDSMLSHTVERTTNSDKTTSDPDLHTLPASNVFQIFKVPDQERATASISVKAFGTRTQSSPLFPATTEHVTITCEIYSYTSKDLVTGKSLLRTASGTSTGGSGNTGDGNLVHPSTTVTATHNVTNTTGSDLFLAVAFKITNDDDTGSSNHFKSGQGSDMDITFTGSLPF